MQYCAYIQSTLYFNPDFYIRLSSKQISLLDILLDCTVKVIKPLYNVQKASSNCFATYNSHYKEKFKIIEFTYSFFLFAYRPSWYHCLVYYLTVLLKSLLFIICNIKTNLLVIQIRLLFILQIIFISYMIEKIS